MADFAHEQTCINFLNTNSALLIATDTICVNVMGAGIYGGVCYFCIHGAGLFPYRPSATNILEVGGAVLKNVLTPGSHIIYSPDQSMCDFHRGNVLGC